MDLLKKMNIDTNMIEEILKEHIITSKSLLNNIDEIDRICKLALATIESGGKIILCGNGGSASDASHIAAEFVGKFEIDRKSLPAISLSNDMSTITAISNDYGFEDIFSRQIQALGNINDLLIPISTSGNSKNIIKAIRTANELGIKSFVLSGKDGGKISELKCNIIKIQSFNTARIQEMHILIGHIICKFVEQKISNDLA